MSSYSRFWVLLGSVILSVLVLMGIWSRFFSAAPLPPPLPSSRPPTPPASPAIERFFKNPPDMTPSSTAAGNIPFHREKICDEGYFICVASSYQGALLPNPFTVTGTAVAFESQFAWKLMDATGQEMASGTAMAQAPDVGQPGLFKIRAAWAHEPLVRIGMLVLFEPSPRDGLPTHMLTIPVRF